MLIRFVCSVECSVVGGSCLSVRMFGALFYFLGVVYLVFDGGFISVLFLYLSIYLSIYLSLYLYIFVCVCLCVCLCVCVCALEFLVDVGRSFGIGRCFAHGKLIYILPPPFF